MHVLLLIPPERAHLCILTSLRHLVEIQVFCKGHFLATNKVFWQEFSNWNASIPSCQDESVIIFYVEFIKPGTIDRVSLECKVQSSWKFSHKLWRICSSRVALRLFTYVFLMASGNTSDHLIGGPDKQKIHSANALQRVTREKSSELVLFQVIRPVLLTGTK
jgi:hypothetical protein